MFSQLCRARPRILWNKLAVRQTTTEANEVQRTDDSDVDGEDRCQLEHCTFCDYRLCCQVTNYPAHDWETECLHSSDSDAKVTENPAYGLSSKNWLETVEDNNDGRITPEVVSMDSPDNVEQNADCDNPEGSLILSNTLKDIIASQQDCDDNTVPKMNQMFQQNKMESRLKLTEEIKEAPKHEHSSNDLKNGKLTWSVLRHRQLSGDILKNCDNKTSNVIEHSTNDKSHQINCQDRSADPSFTLKTKKSIKDRSFPLSLMKPIVKISEKKTENASQQLTNHTPKNDISRQRPVQRNVREKYHNTITRETDNSKKSTGDVLGLNNPLSEIAQIKTEESIQEWLARISDSANSSWPDDTDDKDIREPQQKSAWNSINNTDEEKNRDNIRHKPPNCRSNSDGTFSNKINHLLPDMPRSQEKSRFDDQTPKIEELDTTSVLSNASKASPANIPMVVMQCSRLHSHIGCKPPFQQTSLPMGTLVTALYQESEWLYVQTPHGIEGFVSAANCASIGTINEPTPKSRRPWEPCDFPIQINSLKKQEFNRQKGSYIPAKLPPTNNGKQAAPFVNTVKMKTNFYNDRYFPNHTFKSKDSIKIAKTVTDILRSSPETKVSNQ